MSLTKTDIVDSIRGKLRFQKRDKGRQQLLFPEMGYVMLSKKRALELVDTTLEIIKRTLEKEDTLLVTGFGKFKVRFKWARKGRNPRTGEQIILRSHRVVTFQCSPTLKEKINRDKGS